MASTTIHAWSEENYTTTSAISHADHQLQISGAAARDATIVIDGFSVEYSSLEDYIRM